VVEEGLEPTPVSGRQEALENVVNRHIWSADRSRVGAGSR